MASSLSDVQQLSMMNLTCGSSLALRQSATLSMASTYSWSMRRFFSRNAERASPSSIHRSLGRVASCSRASLSRLSLAFCTCVKYSRTAGGQFSFSSSSMLFPFPFHVGRGAQCHTQVSILASRWRRFYRAPDVPASSVTRYRQRTPCGARCPRVLLRAVPGSHQRAGGAETDQVRHHDAAPDAALLRRRRVAVTVPAETGTGVAVGDVVDVGAEVAGVPVGCPLRAPGGVL